MGVYSTCLHIVCTFVAKCVDNMRMRTFVEFMCLNNSDVCVFECVFNKESWILDAKCRNSVTGEYHQLERERTVVKYSILSLL